MTINKNDDLLKRMMILEKFIELKSNECSYYRTKVHLMQMNSFNFDLMKNNNKFMKQASSDDEKSQENITNNKHQRYSLPRLSSSSSSLVQAKTSINKQKQTRNNFYPNNLSVKINQSNMYKHLPFSSSSQRKRQQENSTNIYAKNQNSHDIPMNEKNLPDKKLISYINKQCQQINAHDKNIQCNENDFHLIELSSQRRHVILMIQLSSRFLNSLLRQQKTRRIKPKLKVHLSKELLNKLLTSDQLQKEHINKFHIQTQYGTLSASINNEYSIDAQRQNNMTYAKADLNKDRHEHRSSIVRHVIRTGSTGSTREKVLVENNLFPINSYKTRRHRQKKRHIKKPMSTSDDDYTKQSSIYSNKSFN